MKPKTNKTTCSFFYKMSLSCTLGVGLLLAAATGSRAQTFSLAVQPGEVFPLPTSNSPTMPGIPSGTFYNGHSGGSCYSQTFDFDGDFRPDDVYVWAINHPNVGIYDNAVAYKVVDQMSGTVKYRGMHYVGGDVTELNVGMYKGNSSYNLVVAYWRPNSGRHEVMLTTFNMGTSTGLTKLSDVSVYTGSVITSPVSSLHLSMDCHDMRYVSLFWDEPTAGIYGKAYKVLAGAFVPGPNVLVAPSGATPVRLPDIAMSHQGVEGDLTDTTGVNVHLAFVDPTGTIYKQTVDFHLLHLGFLGITLEDMIPLGAPIGSRFDEFQLKIDAPDHHTSPRSNWSMVYYNNNMNKINLRMCNRALGTPINSYVVNDGTLSGSSGDLTVGAHAFPSVTYHPDGDKVYVDWFSTYDMAGLSPIDLYTYQNFSTRYLSVIVDDNGNQLQPDYQLVDDNYRLSWIYNYPQICMSKNNSGSQLFTLYAGHGPVTVWPWPGSFLTKYTEYSMATPTPGTTTPVVAGLYYAGVTHTPGPGTSKYLAHKTVDWYSGSSPYYRKAAIANTVAADINVYPNPFNQEQWFRLGGGDATATYTASLLSIDGKLITTQSGTISTLNSAFQSLQSQQLSAGVYLLKINDAAGKPLQQIQLIKK